MPTDANPTVAMIVRAVITVALGVFAWITGDQAMSSLIVGAVVGYWLREGEGQARRRRQARGGRGATDPTTAPTPTTDPEARA